MKEVIGVRFRSNGKIYFFDPLDYLVNVGTDVIVETARGVEFGKCVLINMKIFQLIKPDRGLEVDVLDFFERCDKIQNIVVQYIKFYLSQLVQ